MHAVLQVLLWALPTGGRADGSDGFIYSIHITFYTRAGGLGGLDFPLLSDITRKITTDYGVLIPEEGVALR